MTNASKVSNAVDVQEMGELEELAEIMSDHVLMVTRLARPFDVETLHDSLWDEAAAGPCRATYLQGGRGVL